MIGSSLMNVLVVEDDPLYCKVVKKAFEKRGDNIVCLAKSCTEAKAKVKDNFDVAVVDISLGDGTGFELVEEFLKEFKKPIIFYSDTSVEEFVIKAKTIGNAFCSKRMPIEDLVNQVHLEAG